jgi:hypothetical protein
MKRGAAALAVATVVGLASDATADSWRDQIAWTVGPVSAGYCVAKPNDNRSSFRLLARDGEIGLGLQATRRLAGVTGELRIDGRPTAFGLFPVEGGWVTEQPLAAQTVAALRVARKIEVIVGGRRILRTDVSRWRLDLGLDAVSACSRGEGPGRRMLTQAQVGARPQPASVKEIFWDVRPATTEATCTADRGDRELLLHLRQVDERLEIEVFSEAKGLTGALEAGGMRITFEPAGGGPALRLVLDRRDLAALLQSSPLRIRLQGAQASTLTLDEAGFREVVNALRACARGERGWWGAGAPPGA